ncbi:MIT domain-containing protein 1 isoform X1 [Oopsacas minuta]|uniref:MIT domain-containing protein 1 isoform X1 n=1 Tax=Oopsacas minuta TaxID=111878 RepID=A0AAV7JXX5_9METZ|nr:MIT domain-containing protein 1 isoform X1 [Oopsacas minuta]
MERLSASQKIKEAVKCDKEKEYNTAVKLYIEGIDLLQPILKEAKSSSEQDVFRKKIEEYTERVIQIEDILKKIEREKRVTCIRISDGETGFSYGTLFGEYLDRSIQRVEIDDPYIRASHQVMNLVKLCELLIHKTSVKQITVVTTRDQEEREKDQLIRLADLKSDLSSHGITLEYSFSTTLHDREIRFDNGWVIKIGRGLDYFKPMKSQFQIGFCDMDLRPCQATAVEIYNSKYVLT